MELVRESRKIFIWLTSISLTDAPKTVRAQNPNYKHDAWIVWKVASRSHGYACFTIAIYSIMRPSTKKKINFIIEFQSDRFRVDDGWTENRERPGDDGEAAKIDTSDSTIFLSIKIKKYSIVDGEALFINMRLDD